MQSKLIFTNNAILSCFFFFLIIDLYFLILAIIAKIFNPIVNPIVELIIPLEMLIKEAKEEMKILIITSKTKVRKCSM